MFLSNVRLDSKSLNKLIKGDKIIVKNNGTGYDVSLVFHDKKTYNKLQKALSNGKGSVIDGDKDLEEILLADVVDGQGIMRKLKKGFNKFGKDTKKAFNQVGDHLNKNAGEYVETAKKIVPKSAVKGLANSAILAGTAYIGQPQLAPPLMKASNLGVNTLYAKDYNKPLKSGWEKALKTGLVQTANEEINSAMKNGMKSNNAVPIQEAVPIEDSITDGKGYKSLKNVNKTNPIIPSKQRKTLPNGGSYRPIGKGFKAIGSGFMPIG